jgi:hypothetical protein
VNFSALLALFLASALTSAWGQSLAETAKKEKERRQENQEKGHEIDVLFTNILKGPEYVLPSDIEFRFDNMEGYERRLKEIKDGLETLPAEFEVLWTSCTTVSFGMMEERYGPHTKSEVAGDETSNERVTFTEWWMFTNPSIRTKYIQYWNLSCIQQYIDAYTKFSVGLYRYDYTYREYERFAEDNDKSSEVLRRVLPPPR